MITRGNALENCYVLILLKMYWGTFSNTYGNVLKIAANENGANSRKSIMVAGIVTRMVTRGNMW